MREPFQSFPPGIPTNVPTGARCYDYCLGGKDNFAVDRESVLSTLARFPESLDIARENRLFLYRVVRYLARDAGIRQFLDMGSGLPTQNNVHQVAREFQPDARVVYVDVDPIVLAHGRALLVEGGDEDAVTTVVTADLTRPQEILAHEEVRGLIDFTEPVAVLYLSVFHAVLDDAVVRGALDPVKETIVSGSYLALSQFATEDEALREESIKHSKAQGLELRWRSPQRIREFAHGLEPVEPGMVDVSQWRPDPDQPALSPVDPPLRPFLGAATGSKRVVEYGGVLRKP